MCFPKQHEGIPQFPNTPESRGHWNEQAPQRIPCKEGVLRIEGGHHAARQHNRRGIYIECNVQRLSQTVDRIHVRVHVSQALHNPTDSISIPQDWAIENRTLQQENIATLHDGCMSGSLQPLAMALPSTNESGPGHVNEFICMSVRCSGPDSTVLQVSAIRMCLRPIFSRTLDHRAESYILHNP